ncbi:MAG: type 2 isopentenyl-diphosphate Delta-isomerase [Candidatus Eremiobacterota bacterium]
MHKIRKDSHIHVALNKPIEYRDRKNGFEKYEFSHLAFPSVDFNKINTETEFIGKKLKVPLMITAITGGTDAGKKINKNLARACQKMGVALGLGSQRILFTYPEVIDTFYVRDEGPDIFLLGNIGIHHIREFGLEACKEIVREINADGLAVYLNPLHEVSQEKGNPEYGGLQEILKGFCEEFPFPVIIKETGNGISFDTAQRLKDIKISAIDTAGAGGTSCIIMEYYLQNSNLRKNILEPFLNWGISTADSLLQVRKVFPSLPVIASGGIRNGTECARAISLGADIAGMALPFIKPATVSAQEVEEKLFEIIEQFKIAMFCAGAKNIQELKKIPLINRS